MPTKSTDELVRTLIAVTRKQHDWLRERAFHERTSIAAEVRAYVQRAMDEDPSTNRPARKRRQ